MTRPEKHIFLSSFHRPNFPCFIFLLTLFPSFFLVSRGYPQPLEFPSRLFYEEDWLKWKEAQTRPDTVKKLYIDGLDSLPVSRLRQFKNLRGLIIRDTPVSNLYFLHSFPRLEILELFGNSLRTISGIDSLRNLTDLTINHNFISDVSLVAELRLLKNLQLYDNEITDIGPVGKLKALEYLDIGANQFSSIQELASLVRLRGFSIYKCTQLSDIGIIANFRLLRYLNISLVGLKDFSLETISHLDSLDNLRIQGMVRSNEELNFIRHMTRMTQLTMGINDGVTSIDSLKYMTSMEYLDIHSNKIRDISVVKNFPRLIKFVAYRNEITDISPLGSLTALKTLFLFENPVFSYKPLLQMKNLEYLDLSKKTFTSEIAKQLQRALPNTEIIFL